MISAGEQHSFDTLHPFSFITDERGTVICVGRSLRKLLPAMAKDTHFSVYLTLTQPFATGSAASPARLFGELIVLFSPINPLVKLRGQAAPFFSDPNLVIFSLELSITQPSDISSLGLSIADFRVGDPIFDFLLFMQGQIQNQRRLREAKSSLEWKNRTARLLLEIANGTQESDNEESVYRFTLEAVCRAFTWDLGHALHVSEELPCGISSSGLWHMTESQLFSQFYEDTGKRTFSEGEGLPGRVVRGRAVVWIPDVTQDPQFPRRDTLMMVRPVVGAGVPIFVDEKIVAVLEFFKASPSYDSEPLIRFFELLSAQLSAVVARQRAQLEARRHLASLANASKMATLGEIAAGVAHEINNPLHTLTLTSHLLQRLANAGQLSADGIQPHLDKVETCVQRMATIVSELKEFSRDSSHDDYKPVPLTRVINETLDLCHSRLLSKDVEVKVSEVPDGWEAECRPSQISQVLLNLLNNAFDAVREHKSRWIKLEVLEKGPIFEISVTDSGPGIPNDVARRIMDPFFTTKPPGKGTGLGLSISSNIMTDHGGSLTLDSRSPNTRFVMTLPKTQTVGQRAAAL
jgi:C4-dicarboxylate-specific signal transduction histidine kinase